MTKKIIWALVILIFGAGVAFFVFRSEVAFRKLPPNTPSNKITGLAKFPFRLGLDLSGGSHLVYNADVSAVPNGQVSDSMNALRDVIERRINLFGVSEPVVEVQSGSIISGAGEQLVVDLPGITDLKQAIAMIGQTPLLEFKVLGQPDQPIKVTPDKNGKVDLGAVNLEPQFVATPLTGKYLDRATLTFDSNNSPTITLQFNDEGAKLFAQITKDNIGKPVAIYLDGSPLETPTVQEEIPNGQAVISGGFTPAQAKEIVGELNSGALPVPITLLSTQTIGATLGGLAVNAGVKAAIIGFLLVALFLILWYRLPGLVAVISLCIFIVIILALFKLLPVTLTAPGIAGFIISIGVAVDANVLIFERVKEELRAGHKISESVKLGFSRAWTSIRDSNISNLITALILFWFGTSLIKGFALTLGMGVLVSLLSAITFTRIFLSTLTFVGEGKVARFLFSSGFSK